ncbi:hypothetical protein BDA99DRAFT_536833 [Phascolomyces articulosus]|uniref:Uncharacterized protein n=1 Tax=Phascolomyces articulosus TaxID=60185 RepID=A0AAD5PFW5_9FUNG|nr:hypothetical protein BDA99DRAFT_536831 [Phascolomyces articulosus]KAI9264104.1 hypothetical protein BDA99DRAFT_536833 [Phascolomyces articulosus]
MLYANTWCDLNKMLNYRAETYVAMTTLLMFFIHLRYTVLFWFIGWPLLCLVYYQVICKYVKVGEVVAVKGEEEVEVEVEVGEEKESLMARDYREALERMRADRCRRRQNIVYAWQLNYYDDDYYNFIHCQQQREREQQQQREEEEEQLVLQMSNLSLRAFEHMEVDDCLHNNW